jgi:hypothetical protein
MQRLYTYVTRNPFFLRSNKFASQFSNAVGSYQPRRSSQFGKGVNFTNEKRKY